MAFEKEREQQGLMKTKELNTECHGVLYKVALFELKILRNYIVITLFNSF
jgi:hypothetical protein